MAEIRSFRDRVLRSLSAIGAIDETRFYVDLFTAQEPAQFALMVLDPRCLKDPLLEALISNLRILTDLGLYPVLLIGALDSDRTSVRFQSQRLAKELESVSVKTAKLNTATYQLIPEVKQKAAAGCLPILEATEAGDRNGLITLVGNLKPAKVIFLQPSGGITSKGRRVPVINIDTPIQNLDELTTGQTRFMDMVKEMANRFSHKSVYVIASPLNLLAELFTTKGSGTLIRRAAVINGADNLQSYDLPRLKNSIEQAFKKPLKDEALSGDIYKIFLEADYRGGAILTRHTDLDLIYLSKFWVSEAAQGEGIARDIWMRLCREVPAFFWRSRRQNPFNDWYMRHCDGMQVSGDWRVFWIGLDAAQIPGAITTATAAKDDFSS